MPIPLTLMSSASHIRQTNARTQSSLGLSGWEPSKADVGSVHLSPAFLAGQVEGWVKAR